MRFANYHSTLRNPPQGTLHLPFQICYAVPIVGNGDSSLQPNTFGPNAPGRSTPHPGTVANGRSTRRIALLEVYA
jgi:hypothetical protein